MAAPQESWLRYLTTDAQVIGGLTWFGLAITIAGFWVAIWQIRKVKKASDAATYAVSGLVKVVRAQEQSARIIEALEHLTLAQTMMKQNNREAAVVHLTVSWKSLVQARELSSADVDRERMGDYILSSRWLLDDINSPDHIFPPILSVARERHLQISSTISGLGDLSVRLSTRLTGIGSE